MTCLREYNCYENEKTEVISYFIFPAERFTHAYGSFFTLLFLLRNVTSCFIDLSRTGVSRRQLVPTRPNGEN